MSIARVTPYVKNTLHKIVMDLNREEEISPERKAEIDKLTDRIQIKDALDIIQGGDGAIIPKIPGSAGSKEASADT